MSKPSSTSDPTFTSSSASEVTGADIVALIAVAVVVVVISVFAMTAWTNIGAVPADSLRDTPAQGSG
ncbi:hypothetical protein J4H86_04005 [Spiractinospora alimapuensis]|uniref:hypothetical protein n=1 Tax=Spiractinospora alimapuensis TaxID=2820884 RepID=UPI001F2F51F3|nr:hypothetical protein [Spiractinospora alimapuensis]QVQ52986.1 hypothetical protein J4H86_04005 [Spiractinospora alimapuensis]